VVDAPVVPADLVDLARWVAARTLSPLGACLRLVLPPGAEGALRRAPDGTWSLGAPTGQGRERLIARLVPDGDDPGGRRGAVWAALGTAGGELAAADLVRAAGTTMPTLHRMAADGLITLSPERADASGLDWFGPAPPADVPPVLTDDQAVAVTRITAELDAAQPTPLLLHGVTGSGKTEVYLRAIAEARARGRSALVLVPEIALTPQFLARLRARLGERVAVWHSALAPPERAAEYRRIASGDADVVLGARSAVFAPLRNLGIVIVDEEHDASYKQDSTPRYDARQATRLLVRPGLTGWAQIHGRNAVDWPERLEYDACYVERMGHWTAPFTDFWIVVVTMVQIVWQAVTGRGVAAPGSATMQEFRP
jgi:primosomal protein N' (replication factor Y)